jgi:hypothetical protein
MPVPWVITHGADYDLSDPAVGWLAHVVKTNPAQVELIASIRVPLQIPSRPSRGSTATSVAIQMDAQVAIGLYQQIGVLAVQMGWLLPP